MTAKPVKDCPKCGKKSVQRVITGGAGLIFKGSGFYQTDYRSKKYQDAAKKESPSSTGASTGECGPSACKQPDVCKPEKPKKSK